MTIEIVEADLASREHAGALVRLLNEYALDPMGRGSELSDEVKANLAAELHGRDSAHVIGAGRKPDRAGGLQIPGIHGLRARSQDGEGDVLAETTVTGKHHEYPDGQSRFQHAGVLDRGEALPHSKAPGAAPEG